MRWQESESRRSRRCIIRAERAGFFGQRGHIESSDKLLSTRIQHGVFVNVHKNTTFLERLGTVLHKKEIKRFGQRAESRGAEQLGCDCGRVAIVTPDDTEILKHVWVDVCCRWDRSGQFCDGRRRNIQNTWGVLREPRMNENVGYLKGKNRSAEEITRRNRTTNGYALRCVHCEHASDEILSLRIDPAGHVILAGLDLGKENTDILIVKREPTG